MGISRHLRELLSGKGELRLDNTRIAGVGFWGRGI